MKHAHQRERLPAPIAVIVGAWIVSVCVGVPMLRSVTSVAEATAANTSTTLAATTTTATATIVAEDDATRLTRIGVPADQIPIFVGASQRTGLDALHLAAQIKAESGFQNHPCRIVNPGQRLRNHICGIAQLGNGWGTDAQRMDINYSINRQADGIREYMLSYNQDWQMSWRRYHSGRPTQGGDCGKHCRQYVRNIERYVAEGNG